MTQLAGAPAGRADHRLRAFFRPAPGAGFASGQRPHPDCRLLAGEGFLQGDFHLVLQVAAALARLLAAPAAHELAEARKLGSDDRYSSIARLMAVGPFGLPKIRALFEATYFVGLRKAGMPEA